MEAIVIILVFVIALYGFTGWYCYTLGWWRGHRMGIKWMRELYEDK